MTSDEDAPDDIVWQGKYITARKKGRWEYVSRARGIRSAVTLPIDAAEHGIVLEPYHSPPGKLHTERRACLLGDADRPGGGGPAPSAPRAR